MHDADSANSFLEWVILEKQNDKVDGLVSLSPPVLMHGGLLGMAFCVLLDQKSLDNNYRLQPKVTGQ